MNHRAPFAIATFALGAAFAASCGGEEQPDQAAAVTEQAVVAATLTLAPAAGSSAAFGNVLLGASSTQTFVVTNVGTGQRSSRITLSVNADGVRDSGSRWFGLRQRFEQTRSEQHVHRSRALYPDDRRGDGGHSDGARADRRHREARAHGHGRDPLEQPLRHPGDRRQRMCCGA